MRDLTESERAEAQAAIALPGWRWMPGMLAMSYIDGPPGACVECGGPTIGGGCPAGCWEFGYASDGAVRSVRSLIGEADDDAWPDPRDPATAGCLLALLPGERLTVEGGDSVSIREADGSFSSGQGRTLGLAVIRCALDRGRWGDV